MLASEHSEEAAPMQEPPDQPPRPPSAGEADPDARKAASAKAKPIRWEPYVERPEEAYPVSEPATPATAPEPRTEAVGDAVIRAMLDQLREERERVKRLEAKLADATAKAQEMELRAVRAEARLEANGALTQ
uniref:Uncharacterized protein n=2 Tax=Emiliania huxleyi TaxID=2903 RepID=A0A7S3RHG7_EMIHU